MNNQISNIMIYMLVYGCIKRVIYKKVITAYTPFDWAWDVGFCWYSYTIFYKLNNNLLLTSFETAFVPFFSIELFSVFCYVLRYFKLIGEKANSVIAVCVGLTGIFSILAAIFGFSSSFLFYEQCLHGLRWIASHCSLFN